MKIIKKLNLLLAAFGISAVFLLIPASPANALFENSISEACKGAQLAEEKDSSGNPIAGNCSASSQSALNKTLATIINLFSVIIGIIAVIMVIVSGFRYITSNGDSSAVSSAKNGLVYAIVGLIVVALAQVIVRFVLGKV